MEMQTLQKDMIAAMKAKDKVRKGCHLILSIRSQKSSHR